jgi:tryptophan synthase beta chain
MTKKILLRDDEMPTQWYNVIPDIPNGLKPPLDPATKQPMSPEKLSAVFPMGLLEQEMSGERFIRIPEEVQEIYKIWRPSPLVRASSLEKALGTKAKIYFKNEGVSPVGSHKANTAVPQAYYNMKEGVKRIATETGAGQWGSALSFATSKFGSGMQGLYGAGLVRPETLPQVDDAHLRGRDRSQPQHGNPDRPADPR